MLCFRLHFTKDSTTTNTAAATIRQIVSVVFERVITEDGTPAAGQCRNIIIITCVTSSSQQRDFFYELLG